jgi:hypothetical protein
MSTNVMTVPVSIGSEAGDVELASDAGTVSPLFVMVLMIGWCVSLLSVVGAENPVHGCDLPLLDPLILA